MRGLKITNDALKTVSALEAKQFKQVMNKILSLLKDPRPTDSILLKGTEETYRADIGEFRIIYEFNEKQVRILVVGRRNDGSVYSQLSR